MHISTLETDSDVRHFGVLRVPMVEAKAKAKAVVVATAVAVSSD